MMATQTNATTATKKTKRAYKPKVKTGCLSCRTRRVKCDEAKPSCNKCIKAGRRCDGYEDLFRPLQWVPSALGTSPGATCQSFAGFTNMAAAISTLAMGSKNAQSQTPHSSVPRTRLSPTTPRTRLSPTTPPRMPHPPPMSATIVPQQFYPSPLPSSSSASSSRYPSPESRSCTPTPPSTAPGGVASVESPRRSTVTKEEVATLADRFCTKRSPAGFKDEARATLEAALTEPAVRHALGALHSVHMAIERHREKMPTNESPQAAATAIPAVKEGLEMYNSSIASLSAKLCSATPPSVEVVLLCCRVFMCIEVNLRSYYTGVSHYVRGITIMHEASARAYIDDSKRIVPCKNPNLPKIDLFLIKLANAPDDTSPQMQKAARALRKGSKTTPKQFLELARLARTEARAARAKGKLLAMSHQVEHFLNRVTHLQPGDNVDAILEEKKTLLEQLSQLRNNLSWSDAGGVGYGPYHEPFLAIFHTLLWVPMKLALCPPWKSINDITNGLEVLRRQSWTTVKASSQTHAKLLDSNYLAGLDTTHGQA